MRAAGHTLDYPLQYLRNHLGKFSSRIRLQQVGGQKAREATPVSSPSSEQFKIVARAIYETVQPKQVQNRCYHCIRFALVVWRTWVWGGLGGARRGGGAVGLWHHANVVFCQGIRFWQLAWGVQSCWLAALRRLFLNQFASSFHENVHDSAGMLSMMPYP